MFGFHIIRVTQRDIDNGVPGSPAMCPVARALHRKFDSAHVDRYHITVNGERVDAPRSVERFTHRLDFGQTVKPFWFLLRA